MICDVIGCKKRATKRYGVDGFIKFCDKCSEKWEWKVRNNEWQHVKAVEISKHRSDLIKYRKLKKKGVTWEQMKKS